VVPGENGGPSSFTMSDPPPSRRRWVIWIIRAAVLLLVVVGVRGTVRGALDQLAQHHWQLRPAWAGTAGIIYAAGLAPMAWFWHRTLTSLARPLPWPASLRSYFFGHLGKYVPGKALAILLRVAAVQRWVPSIRVALFCSLLETLTMMAAGSFLAAALAVVLRLDLGIVLFAAAMAAVFGLPTLPPVARQLARLGAHRLRRQDIDPDDHRAPASPTIADALQRLRWSLLAEGWLAAATCWLLLAMSLWATLRAVGLDRIDPIRDLPFLVASVALAVVAGFASLLPGGLGVRDLVLTQVLAPACGPANALVAAVLMRLVWLVSELCVCVILYIAAKFR
jgi:uncharacterized membrane protein YbhN (UPF0104 family)